MPPLTEIEHAARDGNLPKLKRLVANSGILLRALARVKANRKGSLGCTLLHHACIEGRNEIVQYLVKTLKVDLEISNDAGEQPIHCASYGGHAEIVQCLLLFGARQHVYDSIGRTPLHVAAAHGHLAVVVYLLENSPQSVNRRSHLGGTPLHGACYNGHLEVVRYLVNIGRASVNAQKEDGKTPLHLACQMDNLNVVMFLVESCHANVQARSIREETPLHVASKRGCLDVVQYLVIHGRAKLSTFDVFNKTPLRTAMSKKHDEVVAFLLSQSVPDDVLVTPSSEEDEVTNLTEPENLSPRLEATEGESEDDEYADLASERRIEDSADSRSRVKEMVEQDGGYEIRDHRTPSEGLSQRLAVLEREFLELVVFQAVDLQKRKSLHASRDLRKRLDCTQGLPIQTLSA